MLATGGQCKNNSSADTLRTDSSKMLYNYRVVGFIYDKEHTPVSIVIFFSTRISRHHCTSFIKQELRQLLCVSLPIFSKPTWGSLRPLESESDVSLYWEEAISTSVEARLRFFSGLQASDISLAPEQWQGEKSVKERLRVKRKQSGRECDHQPFWEPALGVASGAISAWNDIVTLNLKVWTFWDEHINCYSMNCQKMSISQKREPIQMNGCHFQTQLSVQIYLETNTTSLALDFFFHFILLVSVIDLLRY